MQIPFSPPYIDDDIINEVTETLRSGWITTGPKTKELEEEVAKFCKVTKVLGVNSATSAMMLVMHWFGVGKGDEVIIPAYTYCATALAVMNLGATPVMVDVNDDFNLDPQKIKAAVTSRTKVILTVDFAGWPCDYDAIYEVLKEDKLRKVFHPANEQQCNLGRILLLSDAAHGLGAVYKNSPLGNCADFTVFSLHAVKNVTAAEGGLICFNMPSPFDNAQLYKVFRLWSLNGQTKDAFTKSKAGSWQYDIVYQGFKMSLPDVLSAIALAQFRKYDRSLLLERKRVFDFYNKAFSKYEWAICPPFKKEDCATSFHLYPLRIKDISEEQRNSIIELVTAEDIAVNVHFVPLPMLTLFKEKGYKMEDYPNAYYQYCNEISLPVYPQLSDESCAAVVNAIVSGVEEVVRNQLSEVSCEL